MNNLVDYIQIDHDENPTQWWGAWGNSSYAPEISKGDVIFVDKSQIALEDGCTYLFMHKVDKNKQMLRKVSFTLGGKLKLSTPSGSEDILHDEFLGSWYLFGRVVKSVSIVQKEF